METTSVNLLFPWGTCMEIIQLGIFPSKKLHRPEKTGA